MFGNSLLGQPSQQFSIPTAAQPAPITPPIQKPVVDDAALFIEFQKTKRGQEALDLFRSEFDEWKAESSATPPSAYDLHTQIKKQGEKLDKYSKEIEDLRELLKIRNAE